MTTTALAEKPNVSVLFVDDEPEATFFFAKTFGQAFNVLTANTLDTAYHLLAQPTNDVAVVVADRRMPEMSGINLLKKVKCYDANIIRILTIAYADMGNTVAAINEGQVFSYLTKPWQIDETRTALYNAIVAYQKQLNKVSLAGSIAHEMRNPMGQTKALLTRMQSELPLPANQPQTSIDTCRLKTVFQHIGMGHRALDKGLQVIDLTLDEVNNKPIDPTAFKYLSAKQMTALAIHEYSYQDSSERQKVSMVGEDFTFKGDGTQYTFVLFNLMKNALFYSGTYPDAVVTITIQAAAAGRPNQVVVRDTGPGIPRDALPKLFDNFYTAGKQGGTGLGLAYCKRVMTAFGGDITCDSVVGEYTAFYLSFPTITQKELAVYNQQVITQARPDLDGKRVLVVDDQASHRQSVAAYLQPFKVVIAEAENGQAALAALQRQSYDLVVIASQMPVLDGYETTQRIRQRLAVGQAIAILAYSSEPYHEALVKTEQVGMNGLQTKPCSQADFIQSAQTCIQRAVKTAMTTQQASLLRGKTVLVVDDNDISRQVAKTVLEQQGLRVLAANHGQAALAILAQQPCDGVLMDLQMPGLDGLATIRQLRADEQFSHCANIPVIAMSGDDQQATKESAQAAGMAAYLLKPFETQELLTTLQRCLSPGLKATVSPLVANQEDNACLDTLLPLHVDASPLLSEHQLQVLRATLGAEKLARLTADFFVSAEQTLQTYRIAFANKDSQQLQQLNHRLKGEASQIGAQRLSDYVQSLEAQLTRGIVPKAESCLSCLAALAQLIKATREAVQASLDSG